MNTPGQTAIVIRAKNGHAFTAACLESIRKHTDPERYYTILVDDGSDPPLDMPTEFLVRTFKSCGAVTASNLGIAIALSRRPRYVLILDNDTTVPDGDHKWLDRFIAELEQYPDTACVGATTNFANAPQHALTVPQTYTTKWGDERKGGVAENPPVHAFVSFAVLFRAGALAKLGQWDERYDPGNYEDTDYSVIVREAGLTIRVARSVYIHHHGHKTFAADLQRLLNENQAKFFEKWGIGRLFDLGFIEPERMSKALAMMGRQG